MATYKKRGYKPKTKAEKESQIEQESTTACLTACNRIRGEDKRACSLLGWATNRKKTFTADDCLFTASTLREMMWW